MNHGMNPEESRRGPAAPAVLALGLCIAFAGCTELSGAFRKTSDADPLVATQSAPSGARSPEKAAAIAEIRRQAAAGDTAAFPDVFQSEQTRRLAARAEPRSVADIEATEAELTAISEMRREALTPAEVAALDARAKGLRRLAAARRPPQLRP